MLTTKSLVSFAAPGLAPSLGPFFPPVPGKGGRQDWGVFFSMKLASGRALNVETGCLELGREGVRGQDWENYLRSSDFGFVSVSVTCRKIGV